MKRVSITVALCLIFFLFGYNSANASKFKWIRVGKYWAKVLDSGAQSQSTGGGTGKGSYYFNGLVTMPAAQYCNLPYSAGTKFGCKDWTDTLGVNWPVKLAGSPDGTDDEANNTFPIPDANKICIHRYYRYHPPSIIVDGMVLNEPFPLKGDEVAPDKILGTADVMTESHIRNWMGLDIHARVLGWSQTHHDDYVIFDWTIINTGNVDRDEEIELPNQTLTDLYFLRETNYMVYGEIYPGLENWDTWYGCRPEDSLRIMYCYPTRWSGASFDMFGNVALNTGFIRSPVYGGEAVLHVDKSPNVHADDPSQPQVHCARGPDDLFLKLNSGVTSPTDWALAYKVMQYGYHVVPGHETVPYMEGTYPGTHHDVPLDHRGVEFLGDFPWYFWHDVVSNSSGPFTLGPGDTIRIVWAQVCGSLTLEEAWRIGKAWKEGTCEPPPGCTWNDGEPIDNLPPQYKLYPDLYAADEVSTDNNNWAKDCWVATANDSLFKNAIAAQWACRQNYEVPIPPPPPSIDVESRPDRVDISWGNESEAASDFAGYRVYRASGSPYYSEEGGVVVGKWEPIFECGKGTANSLTHSYEDPTAERGVAYYYYVAAFDDGSENNGLYPGESLESGKYLNWTEMKAAYLTRPSGEKLDDIRIVPNPYNISAPTLQYPGEPDKIMFLGLPPVCTIKIYSESGDLVRTIEHTDGSGDEAWKNPTGESFQTSSSGQIVVSGLYIAHIVTPDGMSTNVKFFIVR